MARRCPLLLLLLLLSAAATTTARLSSKLGINYGQLGNDLPTPTHSVSLITSRSAGLVKLYDPTPSILSALSSTNLRVSIMVPNQLLPSLASNSSAADLWVVTNLLPFYPKTRIRYLLVGNEILSDYSIRNSTWLSLVPAMINIKKSLAFHRIRDVKVGTPLAMDALSSSFPPSAGAFRPDISKPVILPLLRFLHKTKSFYFVDVYPYFVWAANSATVSLSYALLDPAAPTYTDPTTKLVYKTMLDQQLDAVAFAMQKLGYPQVRIAIAETGWPNAGDYDQIGANIRNAAVYNRNLARRVASMFGTPARPAKTKAPVFVFSLYNENQKGGPGTERHWGVYYPNGTAVYGLDLSGRTPDSHYPPLPPATNNEPYKGKIWCVAAPGGNVTELGKAVAYACGQGKGTCEAIRPGGRCFKPNSVESHASYAFNSYWQQFRKSGGTCYFNGLAAQTIKDPSYGSCIYPSIAN